MAGKVLGDHNVIKGRRVVSFKQGEAGECRKAQPVSELHAEAPDLYTVLGHFLPMKMCILRDRIVVPKSEV